MLEKIRTAIVVVIGICALPVAAHPEALLRPQIWILAAAAITVSVFQPRYKPIDGSAPRHDRGTAAQIVWSVYLSQFIGLAEAMLVRYPESLQWDWISTVALAGMIAGLGLRVWAVLTLGRFFTWFITVYDDHQVIRSGPFRFIRHPAYGGALLLFVSTLVFVHAWVGAIVSLVLQLWAYVRRIRYEEELMIARLGESYQAYRREAKALVPLLW